MENKTGLIFIVASLFFISCSNSESSEPSLNNLLTDNDKLTQILSVNYSENLSNIQELEDFTLPEFKHNYDLGVEFGDEDYMFGSIKDVEVDSMKRLFLLDERKQYVSVFQPDGTFLKRIGAEGDGPGEFRRARSMAIFKEKWLLVSNGFQIEIFDLKHNDLKHLESIQFENRIKSICVSNDRLFLNFAQIFQPDELQSVSKIEVNLVHAFELPSFQKTFSFGESYKNDIPFIVDRLSSGNVTCDQDSKTVFLISDKFPVIKGYSVHTGELKWQLIIDGLKQQNIVEVKVDGQTGLNFSLDDSGIFDTIKPVVYFKNGFYFLQVDRRYVSNDEKKKPKVFTWIVNSLTGNSFSIQEEIPLMMQIKNDISVSVSEDNTRLSLYHLE
jgi:hypothetical protein